MADPAAVGDPADTIIIATPNDLRVDIIKIEDQKREINGNTGKKRTRMGSIRVEKAKLMSGSEHFRTMLSGGWAESNKTRISLIGDTVKSMEVWFGLFHSTLSSQPSDLDSIPIREIWHVIIAGDKYNFELERMKDWFIQWCARKMRNGAIVDMKLRRQMFPCYAFDHTRGFQVLTRHIVYNSPGHITASNPTAEHEVQLRPLVIQQLNAARGSLRTFLHTELFKPVRSILSSSRCNCRYETFFNYFRELQRRNVWPLEETFVNTSVQEMLERLAHFDDSNLRPRATSRFPDISSASTDTANAPSTNPRPTLDGCDDCGRDWRRIVSKARSDAAKHFDGLCLVCMDKSKNLTLGKNWDHDYWTHGREGRYDTGCGITHGESSWYFSYMGRKEKLGLIS